ncbi:MAG: GEVED domain-containing protein, partial [Bacteroidota bacterium]
MMKKLRLTNFVLAVTVALLAMFGTQAQAQPTNYCIPTDPELANNGYYYCYPEYLPSISSYYDWYFPAMITHVKIYNNEKTALERESGNDPETDFEGCWIDTGVEGELALGGDYKLYVKVQEVYYSYSGNDYCEMYNYRTYYTTRIFIDWNMDGIFDPSPESGEWINDDRYNHPNRINNHPSNNYTWRYMEDCSAETEFEYVIHVPSDIEPGKTKMRVMHSYYYPYSPYYDPANACYNGYYNYTQNPPSYVYGYGEVEDYILNFQLAFKESFPDDVPPRDILLANHLYNGETRTIDGEEMEFPQPSVTFGAPQDDDVTLNYQIVGPLPSDEVVYEGIDPVTGSTNIQVGGTGDAYYEIQDAQGRFAESAGGFKATSGGEYRLVLTVNKTGSPSRSASKIFTVMWDDDISVREIESPKSNQTSGNFKYLAGQSIDFKAAVQNTGLNPVTSFDTEARIYDPDGNLVIERSDSWSATPANALQSRKKAIIDYGAFRLSEVGV